MDLKEQIASGDQYSSNITKSETLLNVTNTSLTSMATLMQQVKKLFDPHNIMNPGKKIVETGLRTAGW